MEISKVEIEGWSVMLMKFVLELAEELRYEKGKASKETVKEFKT